LSNTPNLVKLRIAEKWDGVLPKFNTGAVPFINLDKEDEVTTK
jgi:hypothetical protein